MGFPDVSVLLPYKNASATLAAALSGLLETGDPGVEVLAIDDGSCDSGPRQVASWATRDSRVRPLTAPGSGLISALNAALGHARGAFIARMDADDIAHPQRLSRQRAHLRNSPTLDVVGCRVEAFCPGGEVGEGLTRYVAWQNSLLTPEDHARELFIESPLCHPSVMLRRERLSALGGYRDLPGPEDYDLWLRCDAAGLSMAKLPETLLSWRHTSGRATFCDARYSPASFRKTKAPFLAKRLRKAGTTRYVMWGAGPTGRRLARELEAHGARPACFVDIDPRKLGRTARGVPIVAPDGLDGRRDLLVIAVGARGARELIRPELSRLGFTENENAWFAA